jgi:hypothetical protein
LSSIRPFVSSAVIPTRIPLSAPSRSVKPNAPPAFATSVPTTAPSYLLSYPREVPTRLKKLRYPTSSPASTAYPSSPMKSLILIYQVSILCDATLKCYFMLHHYSNYGILFSCCGFRVTQDCLLKSCLATRLHQLLRSLYLTPLAFQPAQALI